MTVVGVNTGEQWQFQIPLTTSTCTIERLEMTMNVISAQSELVTLSNGQARHALHLGPLDDGIQLVRPEITPNLARFARGELSAGQRWTLAGSLDLAQARLHINHHQCAGELACGDEATVYDPFGIEPAPPCVAERDTPALPNLICQIDEGVAGLSLTDDLDVDVFLLSGPLNHTFLPGQESEVFLSGTGGAPVMLELRAYRAGGPIAIGSLTNDGASLSFQVPQEYVGRYLTLHVMSHAHLDAPLPYDLRVVIDE